MDHEDQEMGPIQIIMFGIDEPKFDGSVLDQIADLEDEGIVLLLDAAVMVRESETEFTIFSLEAPGFEDRPFLGSLVAMLLGFTATPEGSSDSAGDPDLDLPDSAVLLDLAAGLEIGSAAGVLVLEQVWAGGLMGAIRKSGGVILAEGLLHAEDLIEEEGDERN